MTYKIPPHPLQQDPANQRRVEHTALRKRMLTGMWLQDLIDAIGDHIPQSRQAAWGVPDMSSNIFKAATSALCGLYSEPPLIGVNETKVGQSDGLIGRSGLINRGGLWSLMQRVQFFTLGLRETFLRVDITDDGSGLLYRIVTPEMVEASASAGDPSRPHTIKETRLRFCECGKKYEWTVDCLSIQDMSNPKYEIYTINQNGERGEDVTEKYLGSMMSGESYPYRDSKGVPFLPYSLYHAEIHGDLFDPFNGREVVEGALHASVLYTYFLHLAMDHGSHASRFGSHGQQSPITSRGYRYRSSVDLGIHTGSGSYGWTKSTDWTIPSWWRCWRDVGIDHHI